MTLNLLESIMLRKRSHAQKFTCYKNLLYETTKKGKSIKVDKWFPGDWQCTGCYSGVMKMF